MLGSGDYSVMWCATGLHLPAADSISVSMASSGRARARYPAAITRVCGQVLEIMQHAMGSSLKHCLLETQGTASTSHPARYLHKA